MTFEELLDIYYDKGITRLSVELAAGDKTRDDFELSFKLPEGAGLEGNTKVFRLISDDRLVEITDSESEEFDEETL